MGNDFHTLEHHKSSSLWLQFFPEKCPVPSQIREKVIVTM